MLLINLFINSLSVLEVKTLECLSVTKQNVCLDLKYLT